MNTTNGKIAEQSRISLTNALLKIMEQYDYKEITVTQISQEANLSRKTFYRLYSGKEEIMNSFLRSKANLFFEQIKKLHLHHYWDVVQLFFDFWQEQRSLLLLLKKNNLLFLLFETCYQYSFEAFELVRSRETASIYEGTLPYMLAYSLGGMSSMLLKWVEDDMKTPSHIFIEQLKHGLRSFEI